MKPLLKKLDVNGIDELARLVADNLEGIEPGMRVLERGIFLGRAMVDVLGVDAGGAQVLVATGFTADDDLLMRIVDAYSWCLEYPESLTRHHGTARVSGERPPRVIIVVERMPEAFQRKLKQLNVASVDCFEFRWLDVGGSPAMYFEPLTPLHAGSRHVDGLVARAAEAAWELERVTPATTDDIVGLAGADAGSDRSFSSDGVLTQQWANFLNQLSTR